MPFAADLRIASIDPGSEPQLFDPLRTFVRPMNGCHGERNRDVSRVPAARARWPAFALQCSPVRRTSCALPFTRCLGGASRRRRCARALMLERLLPSARWPRVERIRMSASARFKTLTRLGFAARGLLYIVIALLLFRSGRSEDASGALAELGQERRRPVAAGDGGRLHRLRTVAAGRRGVEHRGPGARRQGLRRPACRRG